jgi:hypothetical protein
VADHGKGKISKAKCTWHMRVPFAGKSQGNFTGRWSGPKTPPGSKGEQRQLRPALLRALDSWPWSEVYQIRDPDKVLDFISRGIVHGLD